MFSGRERLSGHQRMRACVRASSGAREMRVARLCRSSFEGHKVVPREAGRRQVRTEACVRVGFSRVCHSRIVLWCLCDAAEAWSVQRVTCPEKRAIPLPADSLHSVKLQAKDVHNIREAESIDDLTVFDGPCLRLRPRFRPRLPAQRRRGAEAVCVKTLARDNFLPASRANGVVIYRSGMGRPPGGIPGRAVSGLK